MIDGENDELYDIIKQIALLAGVLIGVLLSESILAYKGGSSTATLPNYNTADLIIRTGIALIVVPAVYNQTLKSDSPFVVKFCLYVQNGVFWPLILDALSKKP